MLGQLYAWLRHEYEVMEVEDSANEGNYKANSERYDVLAKDLMARRDTMGFTAEQQRFLEEFHQLSLINDQATRDHFRQRGYLDALKAIELKLAEIVQGGL